MKASFALHSGVGGMQSQASQRTLVERVVRNDRIIVIASVTVIVILSAFYTVFGVGMNMTALDMTRMARPIGEPMTMGMQPHWTAAYAVLIFLMWWVMMVAMMTRLIARLRYHFWSDGMTYHGAQGVVVFSSISS